jgi:hypothetical protein
MANEVKKEVTQETKVEETKVETPKVEPVIEVKEVIEEKPSFGKAFKQIGAGLKEFGKATVSGAKKVAPIVGVAAAAAGGFALYNAMKDKSEELDVIDSEAEETEEVDTTSEE